MTRGKAQPKGSMVEGTAEALLKLQKMEAETSSSVPSEISLKIPLDTIPEEDKGELHEAAKTGTSFLVLFEEQEGKMVPKIKKLDSTEDTNKHIGDAVSQFFERLKKPDSTRTSDIDPTEMLMISLLSLDPENQKNLQRRLKNSQFKTWKSIKLKLKLDTSSKKLYGALRHLANILTSSEEISKKDEKLLEKTLVEALKAKNIVAIETLVTQLTLGMKLSKIEGSPLNIEEATEVAERKSDEEQRKAAEDFLSEVSSSPKHDEPEIRKAAKLIAEAKAREITAKAPEKTRLERIKAFVKENSITLIKKLGLIGGLIVIGTIIAPALPALSIGVWGQLGISSLSLVGSIWQLVSERRKIDVASTIDDDTKKQLKKESLKGAGIALGIAGLSAFFPATTGFMLLKLGLRLTSIPGIKIWTKHSIEKYTKDKLSEAFSEAQDEARTYIDTMIQNGLDLFFEKLTPQQRSLFPDLNALYEQYNGNKDKLKKTIEKSINLLYALSPKDREHLFRILEQLETLQLAMDSQIQLEAGNNISVSNMLRSTNLSSLDTSKLKVEVAKTPEHKEMKKLEELRSAIESAIKASISAFTAGASLASIAGTMYRNWAQITESYNRFSQSLTGTRKSQNSIFAQTYEGQKHRVASNPLTNNDSQSHPRYSQSNDAMSGASNIHSGNASGAGRVYGETSVGDHRAPPSGYEDRYNTVNGTHPGSNASGSISFNPHTTPTGAQIYEPPESSQSHVFSSMADPLYRQPGVGNLHEQVAQLAHNVPDNPGEVIAQLASHNPPSTGLEPYYEFFGKTSHWHQVFGQAPSGALMGSLASKVLHMDNATRFLLHNLLRQINADDPYVFAQLSHLMYLAEKGGHDYNWILQQLQVPASSTNVQILKAILAILMPKS